MKNAEKYKGVEERAKAQDAFCNSHNCGDCPCGYTLDDCDKGLKKWQLCVLRWLELDEESKIEPCPFCGSDCELQDSLQEDLETANYVMCTNVDCRYCSENAQTSEEAISKHNKVSRAVRTAKEGGAK